jgi:hypothetical protein
LPRSFNRTIEQANLDAASIKIDPCTPTVGPRVKAYALELGCRVGKLSLREVPIVLLQQAHTQVLFTVIAAIAVDVIDDLLTRDAHN